MRTVKAAGLLVVALTTQAAASSFTWDQTGGTHDWQNAANWSPNSGYPGAAGDVANFTNDITATQTVKVVNPSVTVGVINLGDSNSSDNFIINPTAPVSTSAEQINVDNNGSTGQINNLRGTNLIYANIVANGTNKDLAVDVASGTSLSIGDATSATQAPTVGRFTKTGGGTLYMGGTAIASSNATVRMTGGVLFVVGANPLETNSVVTMTNFSDMRIGGGRAQTVAEVRGNGMLHDGSSNTVLLVGTTTSHGGTTFGPGGRTRPGDIAGDGGGPGGAGTGTGEIGLIYVGDASNPASIPSIESGHEFYFDIVGSDTSTGWPGGMTSTNNDQIDFQRTITTVNGGDLYINLPANYSFRPNLGDTFRIFIDDSTRGFVDGNGGALFDNIISSDPFYKFNAVLADFIADGEGGGFKSITLVTTQVPEPASIAAGAAVMGTVMLRRGRTRQRRSR